MSERADNTALENLEALNNSLANDFIEDHDASIEYLNEEGIDIDSLFPSFLKSIADLKQEIGVLKQKSFQAKLIKFKAQYYDLTSSQLQEKYPALPRIAARHFDDNKMSQEEFDNLMKDGSFLSFLESEIDDESE